VSQGPTRGWFGALNCRGFQGRRCCSCGDPCWWNGVNPNKPPSGWQGELSWWQLRWTSLSDKFSSRGLDLGNSFKISSRSWSSGEISSHLVCLENSLDISVWCLSSGDSERFFLHCLIPGDLFNFGHFGLLSSVLNKWNNQKNY